MAQPIKNLTLGSIVVDNKGNEFVVIAKNHYQNLIDKGLDTVLLWSKNPVKVIQMSKTQLNMRHFSYDNSDVDYYLCNKYGNTLQNDLLDHIQATEIKFADRVDHATGNTKSALRKFFILSLKELNFSGVDVGGTPVNYFSNNNKRANGYEYWTTHESFSDSFETTMGIVTANGGKSFSSISFSGGVVPAFNIDSNVLVSDNVEDGKYRLIFNNPPVINIIQNIKGNYGSPTKIIYTATDSDDNNLTHYISFDNGDMWQNINPTRISNTYTYTHIFNELKNYNCRIKVVDSANNEVVSNMFVVSVNSVAPSVVIVGANKQVITFKVNCATESISKVEVLVNSSIKHTFNSGFDFNLSYEVNREHLGSGRNSIEIRATSSAGLMGSKMLEANKTTYNLPPVGTKVIIGSIEYIIQGVSQSGANQVYTLNSALKSDVEKGEPINILQDNVKVKCALSNVSNQKDFKDMRRIKVKNLKGNLEGYVEEKYELEGEGRYSTIKIEAERFNNEMESEIIELQQYFDYVGD